MQQGRLSRFDTSFGVHGEENGAMIITCQGIGRIQRGFHSEKKLAFVHSEQYCNVLYILKRIRGRRTVRARFVVTPTHMILSILSVNTRLNVNILQIDDIMTEIYNA